MKEEIKKIIRDTLMKDGKYSRKSLTAFVAFFFAITYEFVLPFLSFLTKEYVFTTLILLVAATLGLTVIDKFKKKQDDGD